MAAAAETPAQVAGACSASGRRLSATRELDITKFHYYPMTDNGSRLSNATARLVRQQQQHQQQQQKLTSMYGGDHLLMMQQHPVQQRQYQIHTQHNQNQNPHPDSPPYHVIAKRCANKQQQQLQTISVIHPKTNNAASAVAGVSISVGKHQVTTAKTTSDNLSLNSTSSSSHRSLDTSSSSKASPRVGPEPAEMICLKPRPPTAAAAVPDHSNRGGQIGETAVECVGASRMISSAGAQRSTTSDTLHNYHHQATQPLAACTQEPLPTVEATRDKCQQHAHHHHHYHHQNNNSTTTTTTGSNQLPLTGAAQFRIVQQHSNPQAPHQVQTVTAAAASVKPTIEEQLRLLFNPDATTDPSTSPQQHQNQKQQAGSQQQAFRGQPWNPAALKWASMSHPPSAGRLVCLDGSGGRLSQSSQRYNFECQQQRHQSNNNNNTQTDVNPNLANNNNWPHKSSLGNGGPQQQEHQSVPISDEQAMMLFMLASRRAAALTNTPADKEARILQWIHDCNRARLATTTTTTSTSS